MCVFRFFSLFTIRYIAMIISIWLVENISRDAVLLTYFPQFDGVIFGSNGKSLKLELKKSIEIKHLQLAQWKTAALIKWASEKDVHGAVNSKYR